MAAMMLAGPVAALWAFRALRASGCSEFGILADLMFSRCAAFGPLHYDYVVLDRIPMLSGASMMPLPSNDKLAGHRAG